MKKRTRKHFYSVGEIVNDNLKIIEQIRVKSGKQTRKGYLVQSVVYPNAKPYEISESHLKRGQGCSYASGKRIFEGNSLWSHKHIRKYIIDEKEAKSISPNSEVLIKVKCDNCGKNKNILPTNLFRRGHIACNQCSTHTSYPELFFSAYNEILKLKFVPQQRFDDFKGYIFDFVNYETRIIVETHGMTHYQEATGSWKDTHKNTTMSDEAKRKYCKENDWLFIELDCRKSEFDFIKNNINSNDFLTKIKSKDVPKIIDLINHNREYPVSKIIEMYVERKMSTTDIGKIYKYTPTTIGNILKKNNIELRGCGDFSRKPVLCIETGIAYDSARTAMKQTGINDNSIGRACKGKAKSAGKHPVTEEKLTWKYID